MPVPVERPALPSFASGPVAVVCAALALVLTALSNRYGYHREELYLLAAGDHPAWGYADRPPLGPMLARATTALLGDAPAGLRILGTAVAVATVVLTTAVARELGGGRAAQLLTACCAAGSAAVLAVGHVVATGTVDVPLGLLCCWFTLRALRTGDPRWYLPIALVVGVALLNGPRVPLLVAALLIALLAAGPRAALRTWWLPAGVLLAAGLALPALWWQATHGAPALGALLPADGPRNRALFAGLQVVLLSALFVPIWVAGLVRLWRDPRVRRARAFAVAYPVLAVLLLATGGPAAATVPLLLVLLAAGSLPAVRWAASRRQVPVLVAAVAVAVAVNLVAVLPVLPADRLGPVNAVNPAQGDQVGGSALAATAASVWAQVPPERRDGAVIYAHDSATAAALDRFGPDHGLPPVYSGHLAYGDWGPPPDVNGVVLLVHAEDDRGLAGEFTDCLPVVHLSDHALVLNELAAVVVQLCGPPATPWPLLWPRLRHP
ncbi:MAG TPA: glycosyltransferase family 39 protein [Pseudonocardiaceae bacterium]